MYIGKRKTTFAKAYGIKKRCYWECVEEHSENMRNKWGTWWEPIGNKRIFLLFLIFLNLKQRTSNFLFWKINNSQLKNPLVLVISKTQRTYYLHGKNQQRTTSLWAKLFQHFFIILRMEVIYQNYFSDSSIESSSLYMCESNG
jgi:hypothetical protein